MKQNVLGLNLPKKKTLQWITLPALLIASGSIYSAENMDIDVLKLQQEVKELSAKLEQMQAQIKTQNEQDVMSSTIHTSIQQNEKDSQIQLQTKSSKQADLSDTKIQLYGFIRADASYQFEGGNAIFNRLNKVDLEGNQTHKDQFYTSVTTSRIGLDAKTKIADQEVSGKLEFDFRGGSNSDTARVRHAYVTYNNWLIGQTTSSFLANEIIPEILDFGSPTGVGTTRTPMLRYSNTLNPNTQYFVGLEQGRSENRFPTLTAKAKYDFNQKKGALFVRGLAQELRSRELNDETEFSWGAAVGASYKATKRLTLKGDYSHVKGDDKFMLFTNGAYNSSSTNDLNLNEFDAFSLGLTYQFNPVLRGTLGYGAMFANDNSAFAEQVLIEDDLSQNKQLQQGWINLMYSPMTPVTFGFEYIYGERETFSGKKGKDSRLSTMVRYTF